MLGSLSTSRKKARSASGFGLLMTQCAPMSIGSPPSGGDRRPPLSILIDEGGREANRPRKRAERGSACSYEWIEPRGRKSTAHGGMPAVPCRHRASEASMRLAHLHGRIEARAV